MVDPLPDYFFAIADTNKKFTLRAFVQNGVIKRSILKLKGHTILRNNAQFIYFKYCALLRS